MQPPAVASGSAFTLAIASTWQVATATTPAKALDTVQTPNNETITTDSTSTPNNSELESTHQFHETSASSDSRACGEERRLRFLSRSSREPASYHRSQRIGDAPACSGQARRSDLLRSVRFRSGSRTWQTRRSSYQRAHRSQQGGCRKSLRKSRRTAGLRFIEVKEEDPSRATRRKKTTSAIGLSDGLLWKSRLPNAARSSASCCRAFRLTTQRRLRQALSGARHLPARALHPH